MWLYSPSTKVKTGSTTMNTIIYLGIYCKFALRCFLMKFGENWWFLNKQQYSAKFSLFVVNSN